MRRVFHLPGRLSHSPVPVPCTQSGGDVMNGSLRYEFLRPRWWRYARPADFWLVNRDFIQDFVKKNQLRPIPDEHLVLDDPVPIVEEAAGRGGASRAVRPPPLPPRRRKTHP